MRDISQWMYHQAVKDGWITPTPRDHANERGGVPIVPGGRLYPTHDLPMLTRAVESMRRILTRHTHQEDRNGPHPRS